MKKFSKLLALGMSAITACSLGIGLVACGDNNTGGAGGVSDAQWTAMLDFKPENYNNFTVVRKNYNTYSKDEAAEYGEWRNEVETIYVDRQNEIYHSYMTDETYDQETAAFKTETDEEYWLKYKNKYYQWYSYSWNDNRSTVNIKTKADMITQLEGLDSMLNAFQMYSQPAMRLVFKYNSATGMYEMAQAGANIAIQFGKDNNIRIVMKENSIKATEIEVKNTNQTLVSVAKTVADDLDVFIAAQEAEAQLL